jgi:hypothetical protein
MIQKRTASREDIPWIIYVKIQHAQPQGKVNTGNRITDLINRNKLALWKDLPMIFKFFNGVRLLGRINQFANCDDSLVMRAFSQADSIVDWKHVGLLSWFPTIASLYQQHRPRVPWGAVPPPQGNSMHILGSQKTRSSPAAAAGETDYPKQ